MKQDVILFMAALLGSVAFVFGAGRTVFTPGTIWNDDHGVHVKAHGGGMLCHEGTYYWLGEHKIAGRAGNTAHVGVHVYSSTNLYSWTDEGFTVPWKSEWDLSVFNEKETN